MTARRKVIFSIIGAIILIYLLGYTVLTPFIRGVVVDGNTGQPVENAWVMATATIGTRTVAGDMAVTYAISSRHLRTGKNGVFYVFPKFHPSIPTPFTFGNMKKRLNITVRVIDGKRAEIDLSRDWWKRALFVTMTVKYVERTDGQIHSELSGLCGYCISGVRTNRRLELCDAWELQYTIIQHESFLRSVSELTNIDQRVYYSATLYDLAKLYKRKSEFEKALDLFRAVRQFDLKRGITMRLRDYDDQINELERGLKDH